MLHPEHVLHLIDWQKVQHDSVAFGMYYTLRKSEFNMHCLSGRFCSWAFSTIAGFICRNEGGTVMPCSILLLCLLLLNKTYFCTSSLICQPSCKSRSHCSDMFNLQLNRHVTNSGTGYGCSFLSPWLSRSGFVRITTSNSIIFPLGFRLYALTVIANR